MPFIVFVSIHPSIHPTFFFLNIVDGLSQNILI